MSARTIAIVLVVLALSATVLIAADPLVIVGAGYQPPWDTDMELANGEGDELQVLVSQWPYSVSPCLSCPYSVVSVPARGTGKVTAREALTGAAVGGPGIRTLYVRDRAPDRDRPRGQS